MNMKKTSNQRIFVVSLLVAALISIVLLSIFSRTLSNEVYRIVGMITLILVTALTPLVAQTICARKKK